MRKSNSQLSKRKKRANLKYQNLEYQNLELRQMLATIILSEGELFLRGGDGADVATISRSGNQVIAAITGAETASFPAADVDSILFVGLGGNDRFTNDTAINSVAFGHGGNDTLVGGSGNDRLIAGPGNDVLRGNAGDDELRGGIDGTKELFGDAGDDRLFGGTERNEINGGTGDDVVFGGPEVDIVFGGEGADQLYPGHGENVVRGGDGDDLVIAGIGDDSIFGEDGDDRIYSSDGDDTVDGGTGDDVIVTSAGDDRLIGGDGIDFLVGGTGMDRLEGGNGNDRLRGGEGDDQLIGGAGDDFAVFGGPRSIYRVSGDLLVRDMVGDDGTDTLTSMFHIQFRANLQNPGADQNHTAESQIEEVVRIQPIIVSNSNGSNTAEFFGTAEQEREIKNLINDIYFQAKVEIRWEAARSWNNSFANVGSGGTRPVDDINRIIADGTAAGVTSSASRTLNMFFVETTPGSANLSEDQVNGLALDGINGITFQVGDNLPTFPEGRQTVANVAAHEIAHNLGLEHSSGTSNLLNPVVTDNNLTRAQIAIIKESRFARPV